MATFQRKRPVCKYLRTKISYLPAEERPTDFLRESDPSAQYWCIHTMREVGPDDRFVSPEDCQTGRDCFLPIGRTRVPDPPTVPGDGRR